MFRLTVGPGYDTTPLARPGAKATIFWNRIAQISLARFALNYL